MDKRFITLQEASEYLDLPLTYVYRISSQNRLPGKICWGPRTVRVDRLELDKWLEGRLEG